MWRSQTGVGLLDANLLVDTLLLLLYLLLEILEGVAVGRSTIGFEDLDIPGGGLARALRTVWGQGNGLVGEGCDLLLFYLIVGIFLLVLLPVLTSGGRLRSGRLAEVEAKQGCHKRTMVPREDVGTGRIGDGTN